MRATFTPKALAKAREEMVALDDPSAGVMVFRDIPDTDMKRGPDGRFVWTKRPSVTWRAWCIPLSEWPIDALEHTEVDGVPVVVLLTMPPNGPLAFRISVKRGKLHATLDA